MRLNSTPRLFLLAVVFSISHTFAADTYPSKPIRLVVPVPAGSAVDVRTRSYASELGEALGQQVIVDNRPGASGAIACDIVAKSAPDGYTLLAAGINNLAVYPILFPKPSYDPGKDFVPISTVARAPAVLVVHPSLGIQSLSEFLKLVRVKPGALNYGAQTGSVVHLAMELLKHEAGLSLEHIAYKGDSEALTDLLGGHIPIAFQFPSVILPHVSSGKVIALAVTSHDRTQTLPNVPTFIELGYPALEVTGWSGLVAPKGTSPQIIERLNIALRKVLQSPKVVEKITTSGSEVFSMTAEEFQSFIDTETRKWAKVIRTANIKAE